MKRKIRSANAERLLWKEFRAGETIIVDAEDDPESGKRIITFRSIEGFEPPPVEELVESGPSE